MAGFPAVPEPNCAEDGCGVKGETKESMGPTPVMSEVCDGAADGPKGVEVGSFGGEHHGEGGVAGTAVEAGAGEACSGKEMGYGVHEGLSQKHT